MKIRYWTPCSCSAALCLSIGLVSACASSKAAGPGARGPGSDRGFVPYDGASYDDSDDPLMRPPARDNGTAVGAEPASAPGSEATESPESGSNPTSEPAASEEDFGDGDDIQEFDPDDLGGDDDDDE